MALAAWIDSGCGVQPEAERCSECSKPLTHPSGRDRMVWARAERNGQKWEWATCPWTDCLAVLLGEAPPVIPKPRKGRPGRTDAQRLAGW